MYEFAKPESGTDVTQFTIGIHIVLLILVVLPVVILFLQSKRPATGMDALVFIMAAITGVVGAAIASGNSTQYSRPFIWGYCVFFEIVVAIAFFITLYRLCKNRNGVLVINLLVSLFILACLIGLLLPSVPSAREAARRTQCANNLKQIGLAMLNYQDTQKSFPAPLGSSASNPPVSWRVSILPYHEHGPLYDRYDQTAFWDSQQNHWIAETWMPDYTCPSNPRKETDERGRYFTDYSIPIGEGTFFGNNKSPKFEDATGGTSNTFMAVEACGQDIVWSEPRDVDLNQLPLGVNLPGYKPGESHGMFSSHHRQGFQVVNLDGSATFISSKTDAAVLKAMLSGDYSGVEIPNN